MDEVKIALPKPQDTTGKKIKSFLKQFELCIHHLQKSVEQMELDGELSDSTFILYRFPYLEKQKEHDNHYLIHVDDVSNTYRMQNIEIEIATA